MIPVESSERQDGRLLSASITTVSQRFKMAKPKCEVRMSNFAIVTVYTWLCVERPSSIILVAASSKVAAVALQAAP